MCFYCVRNMPNPNVIHCPKCNGYAMDAGRQGQRHLTVEHFDVTRRLALGMAHQIPVKSITHKSLWS
jgi:hypothetical protein